MTDPSPAEAPEENGTDALPGGAPEWLNVAVEGRTWHRLFSWCQTVDGTRCALTWCLAHLVEPSRMVGPATLSPLGDPCPECEHEYEQATPPHPI